MGAKKSKHSTDAYAAVALAIGYPVEWCYSHLY